MLLCGDSQSRGQSALSNESFARVISTPGQSIVAYALGFSAETVTLENSKFCIAIFAMDTTKASRVRYVEVSMCCFCQETTMTRGSVLL